MNRIKVKALEISNYSIDSKQLSHRSYKHPLKTKIQWIVLMRNMKDSRAPDTRYN